MRKLTKKISMLMVLAMLVGLFSGVVSASAASKWSFKSDDLDVAVGATVNLDQNQYENFDLYKSGAIADEATYTITWESSDEKVVFVNAKTGQLRAKKDAADGAEAVITANIVNNSTKGTHKVSFTIVVGEVKVPVYTVEQADVTAKLGEEIKFAPVVKNEAGEVVKFAEHKSYNGYFLDGEAISNPWTPEELGEYTVTVAQFASKADKADLSKAARKDDFKVTVVYDGILSAKQITFDSVAITCGSEAAAKAIAEDASKLGSVYYIDKNMNEVQAFIEKVSVDEKDAKVVNVTLYNNLMKDFVYKFTYGADFVEVKGADLDFNTATRISFKTTALAAENYETWQQEVEMNLYNKDDILIGTALADKLEALNDGAYNISGASHVFFHNAGATAVLKATINRGYAVDGTKIPNLEAEGIVTSYDATAYNLTNVVEWSIGVDAGGGTINWSNWGSGANLKLAIGENKLLGVKFKRNDASGSHDVVFRQTNDAWMTANRYNLWFESSNENVVLVDKTAQNGTFFPVGAGYAQIIVYRYRDDINAKEAIGVYNVEVVRERLLTSVTPKANKTNLSSATDDSVKLVLNAKDQTGAAIDLSSGKYTVELKLLAGSTTDGVTVNIYKNGALVNALTSADVDYTTAYSNDYEGDYYVVKVANNVNSYARPVHIGITVKQPAKGITIADRVITLNTKAPNTIARYAFVDVKNNIDTNFLNWDWNNHVNAYKTTLKLAAYDAAGYLVDVYDTDFYRGEAAARAAVTTPAPGTVTSDVYYYTVTKDIYTDWTNKVEAGNEFIAVAVTNTSQLVKTYGTGSYVVNAYKVKGIDGLNQYLATTTIKVTDTTPGITAVKLDNKLSSVSNVNPEADIKTIFNRANSGKISFLRSGKGINVSVADVDAIAYVNPSNPGTIARVNVQTVKVKETYCNGTYYFEYPVDVYFSYEVQ